MNKLLRPEARSRNLLRDSILYASAKSNLCQNRFLLRLREEVLKSSVDLPTRVPSGRRPVDPRPQRAERGRCSKCPALTGSPPFRQRLLRATRPSRGFRRTTRRRNSSTPSRRLRSPKSSATSRSFWSRELQLSAHVLLKDQCFKNAHVQS